MKDWYLYNMYNLKSRDKDDTIGIFIEGTQLESLYRIDMAKYL